MCGLNLLLLSLLSVLHNYRIPHFSPCLVSTRAIFFLKQAKQNLRNYCRATTGEAIVSLLSLLK